MKKASNKITALFEFASNGRLRSVFLNSESEADQKILEQGLLVLLKPEKFSSLKKLFKGFR